jgi:tetratricopeptide (TPR) repeat protein
MKALLFSLIAIVSLQLTISSTTLYGQEFYLPLSTTSKTAENDYHAATLYASNVNFDAARYNMDKALAADPLFFMAYAYAYQVYATDEEKPALMEKALAIDPANFTEAEKIMRELMLVWKEEPKTLPTEAMKALVAAYPTTAEAYEWAYLHAAYTEGNMEAAFAYAQKLLEMVPDSPPVYNFMGYYYLQAKQMDKAKAAFEKYLELAPTAANAHDSMGDYYMNIEDYEKSAEYYDQAAALGMESSKERAEKARALIKE